MGAQGWPAPEQVERDGWLLRSAAGVTQRANSAVPLADDPDPAVVEAFYDARALPPVVQVGPGALDSALAARGWVAGSPTDVLVGPLPAGDPRDAQVDDVPSDAWLDVARALPAPEREVLRRIVTGVPAGYAAVLRGGAPVAVGRAVRQGTWLYVAALAVVPEHRRQGLARAVLAALGAWGAAGGCTRVHLQVEQGNARARALYADLERAETYAYRTRG